MPRFDIQLAIHIHERRHQMGMIREIKSTQRSRILIRKSSNIKTAHSGEGGTARTYASQSEVEAANGLNLAAAPFQTQRLVFSKAGRSSERCCFFCRLGHIRRSSSILTLSLRCDMTEPTVLGRSFRRTLCTVALYKRNPTKAATAAASKVRVIYCAATPRRRPLIYHMARTAPGLPTNENV